MFLQQNHLDHAEGKGGWQCPEMAHGTQLQPVALHKSQGPAQQRRRGWAMVEPVGQERELDVVVSHAHPSSWGGPWEGGRSGLKILRASET